MPGSSGGAAGFVVASSCPRCGAPLDFAEGSNAVRCKHCASMLLVTGRRCVLSYAIDTRVTPSEARALVGFTRTARAASIRVAEPCLTYVPYYRLSAEEVFWHREQHVPARQPLDLPSGDLGDELVRLVGGPPSALEHEPTIALASRTIERNFLACDLGPLASWSLGVRPGVLRLHLLQRPQLEQQGVVLRPSLAADAALARALEPVADLEVLHREVMRSVLSLVYFPLWTVATGTAAAPRVTVVDGVSGAIVARDADPAPLAALAATGEPAERVLGFRPLCCPNCGWDLPVRALDVVFHCASCERTWELVGEDLESISSDVIGGDVVAPPGRDGAVPYLPVWQVDGRVGTDPRSAALPQRLFAPAFRWRALKNLCELGARIARRAPQPEIAPSKAVPLVGCTLDRQDALTMARLVALRMLLDDPGVRRAAGLGKGMPCVTIEAPHTRLFWLPFAGDAYSVCDPFSGYSLPRRAVAAALSPAA